MKKVGPTAIGLVNAGLMAGNPSSFWTESFEPPCNPLFEPIQQGQAKDRIGGPPRATSRVDHTGDDLNDVHIVLVTSRDRERCKSVTPEIGPNFNPESRTEENSNARRHDQVHLEGQLFRDANQKTCSEVKHESLPRTSMSDQEQIRSTSPRMKRPGLRNVTTACVGSRPDSPDGRSHGE